MNKFSSICFLSAVVLWSLSFIFGIFARNHSIKLLAKSVIVSDSLRMQSGSQKEMAIGWQTADEYLTEFDFVINRRRNLQLYTLMMGAAAFMASIIYSSTSFEWIFVGATQ